MNRNDITHPLPPIEELEKSLKVAKEMELSLKMQLSDVQLQVGMLTKTIFHIKTPYKLGAELAFRGRNYLVESYTVRWGEARHVLRHIKMNGELGEQRRELTPYDLNRVQLIKEGTL